MRLTADGVVYELDVHTLLNTELIAIERETGMTVRGWVNGLKAESIVAVTAFVWLCRRRAEPLLMFDDVEFTMGAIEVDLGDTGPGKGAGGPPSSTDTSSPSPSDSASGLGSSDASSTATPSP